MERLKDGGDSDREVRCRLRVWHGLQGGNSCEKSVTPSLISSRTRSSNCVRVKILGRNKSTELHPLLRPTRLIRRIFREQAVGFSA
ncbi:hypothetical protein Mapa_013579 [Marchantia paleacea]|nr:hypothetical protein Mapa_013579 [Marchantia paleacea]